MLRILAGGGRAWVYPDGRDASLCETIAGTMRPGFTKAEREFYYDSLVAGGPDDRTRGRQQQLANLLERIPSSIEFDLNVLEGLIGAAEKSGNGDQVLAERLDAIRQVERFIAPAASVFEFMQARDRKPVDAVARGIRDAWGPDLRHIDAQAVAADESGRLLAWTLAPPEA